MSHNRFEEILKQIHFKPIHADFNRVIKVQSFTEEVNR